MYKPSQNNTFLNSTSDIFVDFSGNYCLVATSFMNLIISLLCLFFIIQRLSLNKFIKGILCVMAIQNLVNSTVVIIVNTIMIVYKHKHFITCLTITQTMFLLSRSYSIMTPLISIGMILLPLCHITNRSTSCKYLVLK